MARQAQDKIGLHPPKLPRRALLLSLAVLVGINCLVLLLAGLSLSDDRRALHQRSVISSQNLSGLLNQTISGELTRIDLALQHLASAVRFDKTHPELKTSLSDETLNSEKPLIPEVLSLRIADADGMTRKGTDIDPQGPFQTSADRSYFQQFQADSSDRLVVSDPLQGRLSHQWVIVLARPIVLPDHHFAGIAYAVLPLSHFSDLFAQLHLRANDAVALRANDLSVIARYPTVVSGATAIGNKAVSSELKNMVAVYPERGTYQARAGIDGIARILSYNQIPRLSWYVVVGLDHDAFLTGWYGQVIKVTAVVVAFLLISLTGSFLLWRAYLARSRAEQWLELIEFSIDHAGESCLLIAADGTLIYANSAAARLFGRSRDDLLTCRAWELLAISEYQEWRQHWRKLETGEPVNLVNRIRRGDGAEVPVEIAANYIAYQNQEVDVTFVRDISERLSHETQMRKALATSQHLGRTLARKNEEMAQFTEVLAHHLQEPVRLQHVYTQYLARELPSPLSPNAQQAMQTVMDGAVRLKALLRDARMYLSLEQTQPENQLCDANAAFSTACKRLEETIQRHGAVIECADLPKVAIDPKWLPTVFSVLLENAINYRRLDTPPHIRVAAEQRDGEAVITVTDNGVGIPPQFHQRIFKVFERLTPEHHPEGTGIGLTLAKKIIEAADGRIWVESPGPYGTRICLSLPGQIRPKG